jgi:tetratricopeptide (TPR) repeat protein
MIEREAALGAGPGGVADDATFQYVSHFHHWALARERGTLADARPELERYVADYPGQFLFRCMLVNALWETGEDERARAALDELAADDFHALEVGTEWFFGAALLAEACEKLGVKHHAPRLHGALAPYADYVVITHPEINLGSAARYLGLLEAVMGRRDEAAASYERALRANARMGFAPWEARTQADLARTLTIRDSPGDRDRAEELWRAALDAFDALGMAGAAARYKIAAERR